jgi:hypothetical protein
MAWREVSRAIIEPTQAKRTRRIGIDKPRCKIVCAVNHSYGVHGRLYEEMWATNTKNPPHNKRTPAGQDYLNRYYIETAYLPQEQTLRIKDLPEAII